MFGGDELQEEFVGGPDDGDWEAADPAPAPDQLGVLVHAVIQRHVVTRTLGGRGGQLLHLHSVRISASKSCIRVPSEGS